MNRCFVKKWLILHIVNIYVIFLSSTFTKITDKFCHTCQFSAHLYKKTATLKKM